MRVARLTDTATVPTRGSDEAAGLDLYADEDITIPSGSWERVHTGIAIDLPPESAGLVWPRSGLAAKHGLDVFAGVVDADYRGEVQVVLANHGPTDYQITQGDRIAQLLVQPVRMVTPIEVGTLEETARDDAGFGSTGS